MDRTCSTDSHHCCADFPFERSTVAPYHISCAVDQRFHLGSHVGEVGRATKDDTICIVHLLNAVIHNIVVEHTTHILVDIALTAGSTTAYRLIDDLDQLGCDPFLLKLIQHTIDECCCISILTRTAIEGNYFQKHISLLCKVSHSIAHFRRQRKQKMARESLLSLFVQCGLFVA